LELTPPAFDISFYRALRLLLISKQLMTQTYAHHANPLHLTPQAEEAAKTAIHNLQRWKEAVREIRTWPEYEAQPLRSLDAAAARLGVGKIYYKDESERFGRELGSSKALGAPYAVARLLIDEIERVTGKRPSTEQLRSGEFRSITERVTVCVATDGNQGRGLAYGAKVFGCRCEEVASVAVFLATEDSSYITGQTIYPDGGRLGLNYTVRSNDCTNASFRSSC
jgi:hypothetical protein